MTWTSSFGANDASCTTKPQPGWRNDRQCLQATTKCVPSAVNPPLLFVNAVNLQLMAQCIISSSKDATSQETLSTLCEFSALHETFDTTQS